MEIKLSMGRDIFATAMTGHDQNWYDGDYHYIAERSSRKKMNHGHTADFYHQEIVPRIDSSDVFAFSKVNNYYKDHFENKMMKKYMPAINGWKPQKLWDHLFLDDRIYYCDHHQAHAASTFIESGFDKADILAIDGGGYMFGCVFIDQDQNIHNLTKELPVGRFWNVAVMACGMAGAVEGKVMGLAGYGEVDENIINILDLMVDHSPDFSTPEAKRNLALRMKNTAKNKFDIAASIQEWTYRVVRAQIEKYKTSDKICVAGGVAYNGYMNEMLANMYDDIHVASSPGDEGQSVGVYMHADYVINGNKHIPELYRGMSYDFDVSLLDG